MNPTPNLTSTRDTSICSDTVFNYKALSSATVTLFSWQRQVKREDIPHIRTTDPDRGSTAEIRQTLINDTSQPVVVNYIFTLSTDPGSTSCSKTDTVKVTVYPTPKVNSIGDTIFCNGYNVSNRIPFSSTSPRPSFTWSSDTTVGFGTSGSDSIPPFIATNTGTDSVVATVTVKIAVNSGKCPGASPSIFKITVNPSPLRPAFTSFSSYPDNEILLLCKSSENINFNINSPQLIPGSISYRWTSDIDTPKVIIKDSIHPNTVITFNDPGTDIIKVTAIDTATGCTNAASQVVEITDGNSNINKQKIFKKQPGNLLIYPDNSLTRYQWGYDTAVSITPVIATSKPITVPGQVYQFYIPDTSCHCIKSNDSLDEDKFYYWVSLYKDGDNGGCDTKVYYNGPYDDKPDSVRLSNPDNSIHLQVTPNPNKGIFAISLKGNMYGDIDAQVYNSSGQLVYRKKFVKTIPDINEKFVTNVLPAGVYFLILRSSDLKQVGSRFIISH